jgi:hypothetical protein
MNSDSLFANYMQRSGFCSTDKANLEPENHTRCERLFFASLSADTLAKWELAYTIIKRSKKRSGKHEDKHESECSTSAAVTLRLTTLALVLTSGCPRSPSFQSAILLRPLW